ncbi:MAG: alpha/beta hydrolase [Phycisphaerales bacterium]|nr:MAG: alpha/beta hydrolase [Phycisphaerales bacterium]
MRIVFRPRINRAVTGTVGFSRSARITRRLRYALIVFVLAGCAGPRLAPTPNLYLSDAGDPFDEVAPEYQSNLVEILYATDRVPVETGDGSLKYGHGRSPSVAAGICTVAIGEDLSWPELVNASRAARRSGKLPLQVTNINEMVRFPDSSTPMVEVGGVVQEDPEFLAAKAAAHAAGANILRERLSRVSRKEVYLFIHGYNNTFEDAAFRMAQLWHFLGREGVPAIYSWPAGRGGALRGYTHDRESGEFTIHHLRQFLRALAACPDIEKLHIIAHSRGTDVLTTALRELHLFYSGAGLETRQELKLGNLILAAADLDWEVANQRLMAERLIRVPERFTIYLSEEDRAIGLAAWLFDSIRRIGDLTASDLTNAQRAALEQSGIKSQVQLIDVKVRTDFLGHGYFISNPAVLSDLILILRDNRPPGAENGRPLIRGEGGFWELYDGYPYSGPHATSKAASNDGQ